MLVCQLQGAATRSSTIRNAAVCSLMLHPAACQSTKTQTTMYTIGLHIINSTFIYPMGVISSDSEDPADRGQLGKDSPVALAHWKDLMSKRHLTSHLPQARTILRSDRQNQQPFTDLVGSGVGPGRFGWGTCQNG